MKKRTKIILYISLPIISILIAIFLILSFSGTNSVKAKYDYLVRDHLQTMASNDSDFDIYSVIIYWMDDGRAYIYIDYHVEYNGMSDESFFVVNCLTGTVLRHGTEDIRQEDFQDFYEVRRESNEAVVYTEDEINTIIAPFE